MNGSGRALAAALLLVVAGAGTAFAQEAGASLSDEAAIEQPEADRAYVREVLDRDAVRTAARIGNVDLEAARAGVDALEGERLERATHQARLVDSHLGGAQDRITLSATTIIIVLLLLIILIIAA